MKIGDKVRCTKYVERTRQGISIVEPMDFDGFDELFCEIPDDKPRVECKSVVYYDTDKQQIVTIPWEEFTDATIDKFKTIEKEFDGVYVGTTRIATKLTATYETPPYDGEDYVRFESECYKVFAVVYYANNRKRLVPIDCIERSEQ